MRKTSKQLKEERSAVDGKIAELSKVEARNDAQNTELTTLFEQRESLTAAIEAELRLEKFEADQAAAEARKAGASGANFDSKGSEKRELEKFSLSKTVLVASGAPEARTLDFGFEKEVLGELQAGQRNIPLPLDLMDALSQRAQEKRTMVTSTPTLGGNFIPTEKLGFFQALFNASTLSALGVRFLENLSANTDLTGFTASVTASWAANETASQNFTDATTAARELRPKLLSANSKVSKRLLIQTNPSIDIFLLENIMLAMKQKMEQGVINGAGGSEPSGILSLITQIVSLGDNGAAPSYSKILELIQTVETADGRAVNRKFLINPKVKSKLKNTTIDSGSGAFIMGYNGLFQSQMGVIDGYDTLSTANVPSNLTKGESTGGVLSAMVFGDFSQVVVGQFGTPELVVDPYTEAANATIRYIVNQYVDSTVMQPNALGSIVDMVTT